MMKKIIGLEGKEVMNFAATNMKKYEARKKMKNMKNMKQEPRERETKRVLLLS